MSDYTRDEIILAAEAVDRHGREVLRISTEVRQLVRMAQRINVIDLMVTVVPAFDLFAEDVAGWIAGTGE